MAKRDSLKTLEFDRVLGIISTHARSDVSRDAVLGIHPFRSAHEIARRASLVDEMRRLIQEGAPPVFTRFEDITFLLEKALPEGAVLEADELLLFVTVFRMMASITTAVEGRGDLPHLTALTAGLTGFPELLSTMERSVDGEGHILDTASHELREIRSRLRSLNRRINRRIEEITRDPALAPFLQDDFITKRSGRWVIPVRMDSKGMVKGVVHDVSRTGETAFMEPLEIIGLSNELENLVAEEKAEEIRILKNISGKIRREAPEIKRQFKTLVYLDVLDSIAWFSESIGAETPVVNEGPLISLRDARHPLLMLQREGREGVVPLSLELGGDDRVMVITGPNAGGKTIAIKTVGLLLLMALSGMPVPADSSSSFPLTGELLVDIGDEQSIEANLSTFSAHVENISGILARAGGDTVVLIDELGTGTDPGQGAALGSAVLHALMGKGALVLATTHLVDIVGFVHQTGGMLNASMEFDRKSMTPLYRLRAGEPGQSHALEIARRYGLPQEVIEFARARAGSMQADFHDLLAELREKRLHYEESLLNMERERAELKEKAAELEESLARSEEEKRGIMERAYEEARAVVSDIKKKVYDILKEAKQKKSRASLRELERTGKEIERRLREFKKVAELSLDDINEGDKVYVPSAEYDAEVSAVDRKRGRLRVKAGDKELELPVASVEPARGKVPGPKVRYLPDTPEEEVSGELNLVGLRGGEAVSLLEPFLNRASLSGLKEVTVIHGIGTGALKKAVREHLEGHPLVESLRDGEQVEGGAGVTVVRLS